MKKNIFITIVLSFGSILISFGQTKSYYSDEQKEAFFGILDLNFAKAKKHQNKPDALDFHLKSLATCMESFIYCNKKMYLEGKVREVKWLDSLSKLPESAEKRFAKAQIKLHWAFMSFAFEEKMSAALGMRQAYLILQENHKLYPDHKPTQLYYGLMNTFLAEIPDNFQWLASLVGMKGDAEFGQKLLESVKGHDEILDFERQVWMLVKRPQFEEQEEFLVKICEDLSNEYGAHPTTSIITSFYYLKNKKADKASEILKSVKLNVENITLLQYVKGLIAFHAMELETAKASFLSFNKNNQFDNFKKDANLRIAQIYHLKGDSISAKKYLGLIKRKGNTAFYADKNAEKLANEKLPSPHLLEARILFDGGYWEEAKAKLALWSVKTKVEKTEYYYRMARIQQQLNNIEDCKRCYKSCIGFCPKEKVYFGPFASLYLAEIYLKESNKVLGLHYVNTSHDFSNFEFKQSYLSKYTELRKRVK